MQKFTTIQLRAETVVRLRNVLSKAHTYDSGLNLILDIFEKSGGDVLRKPQ